MDSDDKQIKKIKTKRKEVSFLQRHIFNVGNVFSSIWVRRIIQVNNGFEWFVLGCRYSFLFNFRLLLVIVYLLYEVNK
jgi:hypothetical protein